MTPTSKTLAGRIAIVTGATAGIGRSVAQQVVAAGGRVVVNGRREALLADLAASLNTDRPGGDASPAAIAVAGDCASQGTIDAMLGAAERDLGAPADLVVINAGRGLAGSVLTSDTGAWEELLRTNVLGASLLLRAAGGAMSERGSGDIESGRWPASPRDIVILGSTVGRHISPFSSMYGATKFAVNSLAEAARREIGPKGVRVTLIEPGVVESEFQGVAGYDERTFGEFMANIAPVLTPDDVAASIVAACAQPAGVHWSDIVIRPTRQEYP
ncbi:MAG: SDR family oxidoreductase [Planctomycetota bacterium]